MAIIVGMSGWFRASNSIIRSTTLGRGRSLWPPLEGEGTGVDRWPLRKFSLLVDSERNIVETSIITEYLQLAHPGPVRLLARRFGHPRTSE